MMSCLKIIPYEQVNKSARFGVSAACDILCRRNMHSVTVYAGVSVFFTWHYFCSCDKHYGKTKYIGITAWWAAALHYLGFI